MSDGPAPTLPGFFLAFLYPAPTCSALADIAILCGKEPLATLALTERQISDGQHEQMLRLASALANVDLPLPNTPCRISSAAGAGACSANAR